ncbi:Acyl-CoA N-acyltransferase [Pseudocohnilembus persalinus]|uniref:Acyl-CoA N-acyltransferase n=1 Tax=Pseudocohnilembus persalinus TaxID=266149 RepID=A0A0V0QK86_PSEPJ|nr:Acyl-CoA N-acyltransferase [Pseudocohnilembus persalinus]|eukprot:KRX02593.1 Acyl-CoA N-acyltransferase [Pseudocohnilembus persalinus]
MNSQVSQEIKQIKKPKIQIFYDYQDKQFEQNYYDSILYILNLQYKSIEDIGCRMHWQGLDDEIKGFKEGDYIEKNGGKFYLIYDNSQDVQNQEHEENQEEMFYYNKNEANLELSLIKATEYDQSPLKYSVDITQYELVSMQKQNKQLDQDRIVGCIALRQLPKYEDKIFQKQQKEKGIQIERKFQGEIKRMFVHPKYRKQGFPKLINEVLIRDALQKFGYKELYLDTLHRITGVQNLYRNVFGYSYIDQYNENPEADAVYMYKAYN